MIRVWNDKSDVRYDWIVVAVEGTGGTSSGGGSSSIGSIGVTSNSARRLRQKKRRRNRRLYTTYYGGESSGDDGDGDDDGEVEFSDFSGTFQEAEEACESEGYMFGAPRSAYENAWLRLVMLVRSLLFLFIVNCYFYRCLFLVFICLSGSFATFWQSESGLFVSDKRKGGLLNPLSR